jgi:hypothetical protein
MESDLDTDHIVDANKMVSDTTTPRTDAGSEGNYFSDSPRVTALIVELFKPSDGDRMDMISLARQLERELTEAKAEVALLQTNLRRAVEIADRVLAGACGEWGCIGRSEEATNLQAELDAIKATLNPETK